MVRLRRMGILLLVLVFPVLGVEQSAAGGDVFDVASIKPNHSGAPRTRVAPQVNGRFTATNAPLRALILYAYGIRDYQLVGGAGWMSSERFDVNAQAPGAPRTSMPPRLRALLADRFRLVVRRETRQLPVYALRVARDDGRLGPNLRRNTADCVAVLAAARENGESFDFNPLGPAAPCTMANTQMSVSGNARPFAELVSGLTSALNYPVVDHTALTGQFDFMLRWTAGAVEPFATGAAAAEDAVSIFTAVREQLGLVLQPAVGPVDVVVIEQAQRPTPN